MARLRSTNENILNLIEFFRIAQPLLDTKPGSIARDVAIEGPSSMVSKLYDELRTVSSLQSLRLSFGVDLDNWAKNVGATREKGKKATGKALLCFNSLDIDFAINKGSLVTAKNGSTFVVVNSMTVSSIKASTYKATVSKYKADLDFVGITDQYAVEVLLEATTSGNQGNISKYSLKSTSIAGITNVINTSFFGGGSPSEDDATFKSRVFSIFSGANTGTALGYQSAVLSNSYIIDALIVGPGDPLMTRDGTQVVKDSAGQLVIVSEGSGGKVDIIIFGSLLQMASDGFIYRDLSNTGDPTNIKNDFILGQISGDVNKTVTRKRFDNRATGIFPNQPITNIVSVSGSVSGSNFIEKQVDNLGRVTGNYELVKDSGEYGGSVWGFDRLRWIDNKVSNFQEDKTKTSFNSQDPLSFTDVLQINTVQQNISIVNENGKVDKANRSRITLPHKPITNVTRVFNATTGERYVVADQNPLGDGSINNTGIISISGKSLPAISDTLQVDYTWVFTYDPYFDYDNKTTENNARSVGDSIDWGFSNAVKRERVALSLVSGGSYYEANVSHTIGTIVNVNTFKSDTSAIGWLTDRFIVNSTVDVLNVISIVRNDNGVDIWNTNKLDGLYSSKTIYLPTDAPITMEDVGTITVTITYNASDIYNGNIPGNFSGTNISIPAANVISGTSVVECTYIADINTLLPNALLSTLPAVKSENSFSLNGVTLGVQPFTNIYSTGNIVQNLRQAPSNLSLNLSGTISPGVFTITGTTVDAIFDCVFTATNNGLKQDISSCIKSFLGLKSNESVPSNISVCRLSRVEKVTATTSAQVLSIDYVYDVKGYYLKDNSMVKLESAQDTSLSSTEIKLPNTTNNSANPISIGDRLRIRFHICTIQNSENILFSKAGTLYTNNRFAYVDMVAISSGFTSTSSAAATLTISNMNQPTTRSRYKAFYDYTAPKVNERIFVSFNFDSATSLSQAKIESVRPINADILCKSSKPIPINVVLNIVVTNEYKQKSEVVQQNLRDVITSTCNANALNTTLDQSDLTNAAYTVSGVDRVRVISFNKANTAGSVLSISADKNEYLAANVVEVNLESR